MSEVREINPRVKKKANSRENSKENKRKLDKKYCLSPKLDL